jgi:pilus assembly protein Flp/PilA
MSVINNKLLQLVARLQSARREEGQGLVEYALIIALVSVLLVGALTAFRGNIEGVFSDIGSALGGS